MEIISQVFASGPLPVRAAAWLLSLIALWVIASVPARWLYFVLSDISTRCSELLARAWRWVFSSQDQACAARLASASALLEGEQVTSIAEQDSNVWQAMALRTLDPVQRLLTTTNELVSGASGLSESLDPISINHTLQEIANAHAHPLPDASNAPSLIAELQRVRLGWVLLPFFSLFLLGLVTVNAGMLSQILVGLGIVPRSLTYAGIPLSVVYAVLLTSVEAGIGLLHAYFGLEHSPGTDPRLPRRLSMAQPLAFAGALVMAGVEGYFYSRIGSNNSIDVLSVFKGLSITPEQIFFAWGFLLVMCLFGLGHALFQIVTWVVKGSTISGYRHRLQAIHKLNEQLRTKWTNLGELTVTVSQQLADVKAGLRLQHDLGPIRAALEALRVELHVVHRRPSDVKVAERPSADVYPEIRSLWHRTVLWTWIAAASYVAFVIASWLSLLLLFPSWSSAQVLSVAVGLGLPLGVSGLLLRSRKTFVRGAGGVLMPLTQPRSLSAAIGMAVSVLIAVVVAIPVASSNPLIGLASWLFVAAIGAALVGACRELAGSLALVALVIGSGAHVLYYALLILALCAAYILLAVVWTATWIVRLVAEPAMLLFRGGTPGPGAPDYVSA